MIHTGKFRKFLIFMMGRGFSIKSIMITLTKKEKQNRFLKSKVLLLSNRVLKFPFQSSLVDKNQNKNLPVPI